MKKVILTTIGLLSVIALWAQPQSPRPGGEGVVSGKVLDAETQKHVEYANIVLYRMPDSVLTTGSITNTNGEFTIEKVPFGRYLLTADFIGYKKSTVQEVIVNPNSRSVDVGEIILQRADVDIEEVDVVADRARVEYKIDRKVINVGQDLSATSGTAADVLQNTPSVEVDIEGNVALRGSTNFTVLVNGRPSVLDANDALQQIPASSIKNIEIITNPSAKYDPDGTAGIINIITKKQEDEGWSGIFTVGAGNNNNYNADVLLNYKTGKFNFITGFDYRNNTFMGGRYLDREVYGADTTYFYETDGDRSMKRGGMSTKLGMDWNITPNTTVGLSGRYGTFNFGFYGESENAQWTSPESEIYRYISESESPRERIYYSGELTLYHQFEGHEHRLEGLIHASERWGSSDELTEEWTTTENWEKVAGTLHSIAAVEDEESYDLRASLDYVRPIGGSGKLETGYQWRFEDEFEGYDYEETYANENLYPLYDFNSEMDYVRHIHAAYIMTSNEYQKFGYQVGLRGEYTDRAIADMASEKDYTIDRYDFFPTVHLSMKLPNDNQLQASYTRRIDRPRGYYLEPFTSYIDANNVRQGNPDLKPEYIDSYEINWQKRWGPSFLSIETYYRTTQNMITRLHNLNENNVVVHTFANMNRDHSLGAETMLNFEIKRKLTLNFSGTVYYYQLEGEIDGESIDKTSTNWRVRSSTTYKVTPSTRLQFDLGYYGPSVSAQGERKGFLGSDFAVRQDFLDRKLSATFQMRNVFNTMKRDFTTETATMYEHIVREYQFPILRFTLTYNMNYKQRNRDGRGGDGGMDMEGGDF